MTFCRSVISTKDNILIITVNWKNRGVFILVDTNFTHENHFYYGFPLYGAFVPQCEEDGQYTPLQCHGSTGHCWCVDSNGEERRGTRTAAETTLSCSSSNDH
uniref:Thyroglobulin type-1 domain-containing protein n=1 Tax=Seriola dumerili TaxID=41447 RepID=A0A3B4U5M5_SERDU